MKAILENLTWCLLLILFGTTSCANNEEPEPESESIPPFSGTIFIDPNIITESDRSAFVSLTYIGNDTRTMYDRRVGDWITTTPFLFVANYDDELEIEIQVNP